VNSGSFFWGDTADVKNRGVSWFDEFGCSFLP